ncbi:CD276 antigen homolog isoform X2 [Sander vitreus]
MSGLSFQKLPLLLCLLALSGLTHGVKVVVKEGSDVMLPCSLSTKENMESKLFDWKKVAQKDAGEKEVFLYDAGSHYNNGRGGQSEQFKGRISHFQDELKHANASIIIRNTKISDSGNYTCYFPRLRPPQTFYIELIVAASPEPYIRTLNATADWALLQCEVRRATPKPKLEWKDSAGNTLPAEERHTSERGGSYYITLITTVTETDNYSCVVTQEEVSHQTHAETFVLISAASPEPYIRTLKATADWALLQCEVRRSTPKPKLEWKDSAGNTLPAEERPTSERGGSYYITLITTVTETDNYSCVVTQEEVSHQTHAETFVLISGEVGEDSSSKVAFGWLFGGFVLGALTLAIVQALLTVTKILTIRCNKGSRQQGNGLGDQENGSCENCRELLRSQNGR